MYVLSEWRESASMHENNTRPSLGSDSPWNGLGLGHAPSSLPSPIIGKGDDSICRRRRPLQEEGAATLMHAPLTNKYAPPSLPPAIALFLIGTSPSLPPFLSVLLLCPSSASEKGNNGKTHSGRRSLVELLVGRRFACGTYLKRDVKGGR